VGASAPTSCGGTGTTSQSVSGGRAGLSGGRAGPPVASGCWRGRGTSGPAGAAGSGWPVLCGEPAFPRAAARSGGAFSSRDGVRSPGGPVPAGGARRDWKAASSSCAAASSSSCAAAAGSWAACSCVACAIAASSRCRTDSGSTGCCSTLGGRGESVAPGTRRGSGVTLLSSAVWITPRVHMRIHASGTATYRCYRFSLNNTLSFSYYEAYWRPNLFQVMPASFWQVIWGG
jgi:hypothetical protein